MTTFELIDGETQSQDTVAFYRLSIKGRVAG
jgi:hypothetical protein